MKLSSNWRSSFKRGSVATHHATKLSSYSSSRMRVMNHNWSAMKQRLHPQSVAEINRHSILSGDRIRQCQTSSVWVSPQVHRSVSISRHFLLQAPQCPCSVRKWFSRDLCCWARSEPSYRLTEQYMYMLYLLYVEFFMQPSLLEVAFRFALCPSVCAMIALNSKWKVAESSYLVHWIPMTSITHLGIFRPKGERSRSLGFIMLGHKIAVSLNLVMN